MRPPTASWSRLSPAASNPNQNQEAQPIRVGSVFQVAALGGSRVLANTEVAWNYKGMQQHRLVNPAKAAMRVAVAGGGLVVPDWCTRAQSVAKTIAASASWWRPPSALLASTGQYPRRLGSAPPYRRSAATPPYLPSCPDASMSRQPV